MAPTCLREHSETNVIACTRNINQQLSNHSYLHPLHFGCLSFIIWPYIHVKYIISSEALSVPAQSHDYMLQGNFLPLSKSIFSIFLITTSYIKKKINKRKVWVFLCGSRIPNITFRNNLSNATLSFQLLLQLFKAEYSCLFPLLFISSYNGKCRCFYTETPVTLSAFLPASVGCSFMELG